MRERQDENCTHEGYTLTLWTAPRIIRTAAPSGTWVWDAVQLQIADMPLAETASGALLTWGPHTGLAGVPTTTPVWETPMLAMVAARWIDCRGSHCCAPSVARNGVLCWRAVDGVFAQGFREVPAPALVAEDTDRNALQLAPMSDGALRACVRVGPIGGGAATTHVYCDLADDIIDRGAEASLTEHPELVGRAGWGPRSRSDWYAMCVQEAEDWWRCEGSHAGWGGPPP